MSDTENKSLEKDPPEHKMTCRKLHFNILDLYITAQIKVDFSFLKLTKEIYTYVCTSSNF